MNKLPKEIYVHEESEGTFFVSAEDAARTGETVTLAVYKLVGKVEVSTQVKQEIIVKKPPKKVVQKPTESIPVEISQDRASLLDEMRVTG